ncbi:hypothetical protein ACFYO2_26960 [Streptomyces sp. NPDC006602]|uniref:hypothetical protein n=1 Tax=Streptomyces sp. NPDC006602 TaxID=3364751 RepID=UPI0036994A34
MRTFLVAATGLPTILLTAALVVLVCFWLLVAVGLTGVDSFDTDVDLRGWRLDGVPATIAFSLLTVLAWSLSVGAAVVLVVFAPPGPATGLLRLIVPVGALPVAWAMACLIVGTLHRFFPKLMKLTNSDDTNAGQVKQLLDKAGELGLADTSPAALNGSARV